MQYASDVSSEASSGMRKVYIKCRVVKKFSDIHKLTDCELVETYIGNHVQMPILDTLKRRYRGDSYNYVLEVFFAYKSLKQDIKKYESYNARCTDTSTFYEIAEALRDVADDIDTPIGFLLNDNIGIDYQYKWYGSMYGYLTPFECILIEEYMRDPSYYYVHLIISKRVFKFICKCKTGNMPYWFVPI